MPVSYNTPLDGIPNQVFVATTEKIPYNFDFSANLAVGETVAAPTSQLLDMTRNGAVVLLTDPPVVAGTSGVVQEVRGTQLLAGHNYRLVVSADLVGLSPNKRLSISLVVTCPY